MAEKAGIKYKQVITEKDLMPHDPHIRRAEALVLYTGYGRLLQEGLIDTDFPYLTGEAANYVHYFDNLRLIGIDSPTIDAYHEKAAHHGIVCQAGCSGRGDDGQSGGGAGVVHPAGPAATD